MKFMKRITTFLLAVSLLAGVGLLGVYFLMYRGRRHVAAIYNRSV